MSVNRVVPWLVAIVLLGTLAGCSSADTRKKVTVKAPPGGLLVKGAGATFPSLLYERWFAAYQKSHPNTVISYDSVGSGEGIRRFIGQNVDAEERVDFGASDAAMTDKEIAAVPKGALMVPLTAGSVVLAYNLPELAGELRLSRNVIAGIFLGEITTWNDRRIAETNPGTKLPKLTIAIVTRQDGSGTTFAFTKHLDAISESWRGRYGAATLVGWPGNAMRAMGNEGVAGRIKQSMGSIGYVNYGFARKAGLKMAILENKGGNFVTPTEESGAAALAAAQLPENLRLFLPDPSGPDSYPIVTFSWILLYKAYEDAGKSEVIRDMFRWCLLDGQRDSPGLGYVPLPSNVTEKALSAVDTIAARN